MLPSDHNSIGRLPLDTQFDEEEDLDTIHDEFEGMEEEALQNETF